MNDLGARIDKAREMIVELERALDEWTPDLDDREHLEAFDKAFNEVWEPFMKVYPASQVLREIDPMMYSDKFWEWANSLDHDDKMRLFREYVELHDDLEEANEELDTLIEEKMILISGSALIYLRYKAGDLEKRAGNLIRREDKDLRTRVEAYRDIAKELRWAYEALIDWKGVKESDMD